MMAPMKTSLREARTAAGLSIVAVANRAGVNPGTIWRLEQGRSTAKVTTAMAIASALGLGVDLIDWDNGSEIR